MTYKENDIVKFRKYNDTFVGKIILVKEVLGDEYYIAATEYRTYTLTSKNIIEKI